MESVRLLRRRREHEATRWVSTSSSCRWSNGAACRSTCCGSTTRRCRGVRRLWHGGRPVSAASIRAATISTRRRDADRYYPDDLLYPDRPAESIWACSMRWRRCRPSLRRAEIEAVIATVRVLPGVGSRRNRPPRALDPDNFYVHPPVPSPGRDTALLQSVSGEEIEIAAGPVR